MEVIIIDSISHEWEGKGGVLELADALGGQYQSAWKTLTPRHESFKQAIVQSASHIITTVRRKQDYVLQERQNKLGKMVQAPVKAGFKEVTREGWEYELTVNLELELNHYATASKDRTGLFMGHPSFIPDMSTGKMILDWCDKGEEIPPIYQRISECKSIKELLELFQTSDLQDETILQEFSKRRIAIQEESQNNLSSTINLNNNGKSDVTTL